ncbi:GTP-binding DUF697 domain-containing protein [Vibrio sp. Of7-15]|uniref:YcjF family protein n=1 Tax=Vibrio sp. Of7-15 TaxID=2724879 RepID=UPI001EF18D39|nr:GTPase [Vibrio sp. Of7-15]MCG7496010.1 GTP-binding DUF697 domain-containing protein [Vibrio sp. Of7-15]
MSLFDRVKAFVNPPANPDIEPAFAHQSQHLPTLWLVGKTGAGKSSFIQAVTGDSQVEIGNGFRPCTMTSHHYDFPADKPLLRFLDTRGLAEANYDAKEDIAACQNRSHALVVVMKADEPEQSSVVNALAQIRRESDIKQLLVVHTGVELIEGDQARDQCIAYNQQQIEAVWGETFYSVSVDFEREDGSVFGLEALKSQLAELLPIAAQLRTDQEHTNLEEKNFARLKTDVLWYSGAAGASDAIPAVGLVSVPVIQGKMLHSLANQYDMEWDKKAMSEFAGALGAGFGMQYASQLGIRQLVKIIPVYGQTVGSATAAVVSFCTTYAIGRVACKYLYHKSKGEAISEQEMKDMYKKAFDSIKEVAKSETNNR